MSKQKVRGGELSYRSRPGVRAGELLERQVGLEPCVACSGGHWGSLNRAVEGLLHF